MINVTGGTVSYWAGDAWVEAEGIFAGGSVMAFSVRSAEPHEAAAYDPDALDCDDYDYLDDQSHEKLRRLADAIAERLKDAPNE